MRYLSWFFALALAYADGIHTDSHDLTAFSFPKILAHKKTFYLYAQKLYARKKQPVSSFVRPAGETAIARQTRDEPQLYVAGYVSFVKRQSSIKSARCQLHYRESVGSSGESKRIPSAAWRKQHPEGLVALVTGANRGLGQAVALQLARHGYAVIAACRGREPGEQIVQQMKQEGLEAYIWLLDVAEKDRYAHLCIICYLAHIFLIFKGIQSTNRKSCVFLQYPRISSSLCSRRVRCS